MLPSDADRIYIKCTYQTPLSHLWMHRWLAKLPRTVDSSHRYTMFLYPLIEKRVAEKKVGEKKKHLADSIFTLRPFIMICCHMSYPQTYFCTFLLWIAPLFFLSIFFMTPPSMSGLVPYHCMFDTGRGTLFLFPVCPRSFPSSLLPRQ